MAKRRKRLIATPRYVQNIRAAQKRIQARITKATGLDKVQELSRAIKRRITPTKQAYSAERRRIQGYINRQKRQGNEVEYELPRRPAVVTRRAVQDLANVTNDYLREHTLTPQQTQTEQPRPEPTLSELVKQWEDEGLTKEQIIERITQGTQETPQTVADVVTDITNDVPPDENAEDEIEEDLDEDEENGFAKFIEDEERDERQYRRPPRATDVILHNTYEMLNNFESLLDGWEPDVRWSDDLAEVKADDRTTLRSILNGNIRAFGRDEVAQRLEENAAEIAGIIERVLYSSGSKYHDSGRDGVQQDFKRLREILLDRPLTVDESKDIERDYEDNYFYFSI